ncbi:MAG: V-type ATPase subunit, partial [Clostridiales bacterium]|nr:V-type ATPase subunit [Clostridiales bacterium]
MTENYTYAAAYVKVLEKNMLTDSDYRELIQSSGSNEILQMLEKKEYSGDNLGDALENELEKTWNTCLELCGADALSALITENDFHNIKAVIKAELSGADYSELILRPTGIDPNKLSGAVHSGDYSDLDSATADLCRRTVQIYSETNSAQLL